MQNEPSTETALLTGKQVAKMLSISLQHVLRLALLGGIPAIDLAPPKSRKRLWRFNKRSIELWLREREQPGRPTGFHRKTGTKIF